MRKTLKSLLALAWAESERDEAKAEGWQQVRPRTVLLFSNVIRLHIKPALGHLPVQDLDYVTLLRFYQTLSPPIARQSHVVIHGALKMAWKGKLVVANVSDAMFGDLPKPHEEPEDPAENCWTEAEVTKLYAYASKHATPVLRPLIRLWLNAGMRAAEVLGFQWGDIDEKDGKIVVKRQLRPPEIRRGIKAGKFGKTKDEWFGPLKSGKPRPFYPTDKTLAALAEHRRTQKERMMAVGRDKWFGGAGPEEDRLVFTNELTGQPLSRERLDGFIRRLARGAGIRAIRTHGLKHTCITHALQNGVPIDEVSEQVGTSLKVLMDHYKHALSEGKKRARQKFETMYGGV